jgi:hypothetical protein
VVFSDVAMGSNPIGLGISAAVHGRKSNWTKVSFSTLLG